MWFLRFDIFIQCDITIKSELGFAEVAQSVSNALNIPKMIIDTSGRFEGEEIYISICLGLEFFFAEDDNQSNLYHLCIISDVDEFDFDGLEKDIDTVYSSFIKEK